MPRRPGKVIIPANVSPWEHELKTAQVLAQNGWVVEFVADRSGHGAKTADGVVDGTLCEIKSPVTDKLSAVERNLKRAYHQSANIIFDSRRMKRLPDKSIQKELVKQFVLTKRILFVNRKHELIDIGTLVDIFYSLKPSTEQDVPTARLLFYLFCSSCTQ